MDALSILRGTLALTDAATDAEVIAKAQGLVDTAEKVEALTESLNTLTTDRDALKAERDDLQAWKREKMLDLACEEGRIAASERDRYARCVAAMGEEEADAIFPRNRIKVMGELGTSAPAQETGSPQGLFAVDTEIRAAAERLAEEGLDAAAAYGRAMAEVLSDPVRRALYESETSN